MAGRYTKKQRSKGAKYDAKKAKAIENYANALSQGRREVYLQKLGKVKSKKLSQIRNAFLSIRPPLKIRKVR